LFISAGYVYGQKLLRISVGQTDNKTKLSINSAYDCITFKLGENTTELFKIWKESSRAKWRRTRTD